MSRRPSNLTWVIPAEGVKLSDSSRYQRAVVIAGGDPVQAADIGVLPEDSLVIAADSGLDQAARLGWRVDLAVGDFDSASPAAIEEARNAGVSFEEHPAEKEYTDLDLALVAARDRGLEEVLVVGGAGGRLDHLFGNLVLLSSPEFAAMRVEARIGAARARVVNNGTTKFSARRGDLVSLFALGGVAEGVTTDGLEYPLDDEPLHPGSSRGVSNNHREASASVSVRHGTVLVIHPGELAAEAAR